MKSKIPVILDCYADWCNPCQKLIPILEQKTLENKGKFKLVKVNIDLLPEIANGLSVRQIPAVFLVSGGNVMDTFTGVPSEERIDDFINTAKLLEQLGHDKKTLDQVILAGEEHVKLDDHHTAIEVFKQALKASNPTQEQESRILLNIAF
jgi:putative thioredoxin